MKSVLAVLSISFLFFSTQSLSAQKQKKVETIEFHVEGVCKMCKARIENAALIPGVKMADWDLESGMITVVYKTKKVTEMEIHQAIAEKGHRTDQVEADPEAYSNLPGCCAYDDGVEKH